ncbi:MAG: metal ABC transporter substrate-binding protein [Eubacteriales bacterium]|nr:metal ABC transporter substrate-binding protein [Bacillota bacterium]MBV1726730.1 metal ABC transporter substrate-binding protein [Desulforudis sp.]MDP3051623.1 metal ABC transporter substrate-binding protein [Eubacteriales bacterium]MDQ7788958.1 metal ABC transporter substrate-binding protein [Clostridia bacterium]MBV1734675.1 metal ABC transporter substrate-binding protein [Desulforudis sp.]
MQLRLSGFVLFILVVLLTLMVLGCGERDGPSVDEARTITIVTTIQPIADIASNIGGESVRVVNLLPVGGSPHTYEPTPRQMAAMADAAVFIWVGGGLDDWAETLADAGSEGLVRLRLTDGISLLPFEADHTEPEHGHDHQDASQNAARFDHDHHTHDLGHDTEVLGGHHETADHDHGFYDPHIWLDPLLVREYIAPAIARALAGAWPEMDAEFTANLKGYQEQLTDLHHSIAGEFDGLSNRNFIAFHSAWQYFSVRYGLVQAASVEDSPGKEPSAKWIAEVVEMAREHNAKAIFAEPQFSNKAAEVIAREFGAQVLILDPLGGPGLDGRESYLDLMRYNSLVFRQGLE